MANKQISDRQYTLHALATLGPSNGADTVSFALPPGAVVVGGVVRIKTAGAASLKLSVKDNAGTPVSLFGDVDAATVGATTMPATGLGLSYPAGGALTAALSASDNAVVADVAVAYVINGRTNEQFES